MKLDWQRKRFEGFHVRLISFKENRKKATVEIVRAIEASEARLATQQSSLQALDQHLKEETTLRLSIQEEAWMKSVLIDSCQMTKYMEKHETIVKSLEQQLSLG